MKRTIIAAPAIKHSECHTITIEFIIKRNEIWKKKTETLFERMENFRIHSSDESHKYDVKCEHDLARKRTKTTEKCVCVLLNEIEF